MTAPAIPLSFSQSDRIKALRDSAALGQLPRDPFADVRRFDALFPPEMMREQQGYDFAREVPRLRRETIRSAMNEPLRDRANLVEDNKVRDAAVIAAARQHGVPHLIALGISHGENWTAIPGAVGPFGEIGLMQVDPRLWAKQAGGRLDDPKVNADMGVRILRHLYERYGSWDKAIMAYNGRPDTPATRQYLANIKMHMNRIATQAYNGQWADLSTLRGGNAQGQEQETGRSAPK